MDRNKLTAAEYLDREDTAMRGIQRELFTRTTIVVLMFVTIAALGCSPSSQTLVGSGAMAEGMWVASVSDHGGDLALCLEIRVSNTDFFDRLCGLEDGGGGGGLWRTDGPNGTDFLAVYFAAPTSTLGRVTLADGRVMETPVLPGSPVTEGRFLVIALPAGAQPLRVDLINLDGDVVETIDPG